MVNLLFEFIAAGPLISAHHIHHWQCLVASIELPLQKHIGQATWGRAVCCRALLQCRGWISVASSKRQQTSNTAETLMTIGFCKRQL